MNPAKAAALLNGRVQSFALGLGGERISEIDVAHAMAFIWHPGARMFGRLKWGGQHRYFMRLHVMVTAEAERIASEQGWANLKAGELERVCRLAIGEAIFPKLCPVCGGLGEFVVSSGRRGRPKRDAKPDLKIVCQECEGTGIRPFNEYMMAREARVSRRQWRQVWAERYRESILPILDRYEAMFWAGLRRAFREREVVDGVDNLD